MINSEKPEPLRIVRDACERFRPEGFRVIREHCDAQAFGNVCVELRNRDLRLRFTRDRGQYFIDVAALNDEEWFGECTLLTFLGALDAAGQLIKERWASAEHVAEAVAQRLPEIAAAFDSGKYVATRVSLKRLESQLAVLARRANAPPIRCRIAACPVENTAEWDFFLINDSDVCLDSAVLNEISYEWGELSQCESVNVRVNNLPPGTHERIWRDNGDGAELRMEFSLSVRMGARKVGLHFEFPILYRKRGSLPLVNDLGRPGWEEVAGG